MCGGTDEGGSVELNNMQSLIHNASEYMEELQRCIRDVSEKRRVQYTGLYSDTMMVDGNISGEGGIAGCTPGGTAPPLRLSPCRPLGKPRGLPKRREKFTQ